ncbi:MAG: hypothetical protein ACAH17_03800 [Candidatus Paceibacterota bacterium]
MHKKILAACAVLMAFAAIASVTFNPATGTGFAGKGDVQLAFAWNNAQLQKNLAGVTFKYVSTATYVADCTWMTGPDWKRKSHTIDRTTTNSVNGLVAFDARQRNQITGINLNGFDGVPVVTGGEIPVLGAVCIGEGTSLGTYTYVSPEPIGLANNLFAVYGGVPKSIWPPVVPVVPVL